MKIVLQLKRKEFQFLIVEDIGKNLNTGDDRSLFSPISFPYTSGYCRCAEIERQTLDGATIFVRMEKHNFQAKKRFPELFTYSI